ncbi:MAG TPA: hypothetical protein VF070_44650 [Streptosporangiaceae bacterium]
MSTALVSAMVKGGALSRGSVGGLAHLDGAALDHARAQVVKRGTRVRIALASLLKVQGLRHAGMPEEVADHPVEVRLSIVVIITTGR